MYSLGLFRNLPSRGYILIFTPGPNEPIKKVPLEPLKMTILIPSVKISQRRIKLIITQHPAQPASLRLEMNILGVFGNRPSGGFILIFTPAPNEPN